MDPNSRESLLAAVNTLVQAPDGPELYQAIGELLKIADKLEARFAGERAVLNPLVDLAVSDRERYLRVIGLVETKRLQAGLVPLIAQEDSGYDKTEYMRDFMARKREREARAATIENLMRPESSQLKGRSRLDFMQMQSAKWKAQRDAMIASYRERVGRRLHRDEMRDLLSQFWAKVDRELDELEELARAEKAAKVKRG